ncbi:MAG: TolC family protein [Prosthecobacter sp.]|uniref:TolC family protein n=1 Tax=Prosthecobacter sp. TaxID=1965333 RepID=UPI0025F9E3B2|nr:TolC family protein [Prosthecobacter sp.]MCF7787709.1 TolC family protein [Prosthecobacter sp.]
MKHSPLLFILAASALASCMSYKAHPLSAEASSAAFAGRSLSDPGLRQFLIEQKAEHGTWEVNRLALAAAYFHPDVTLARAEADELLAAIKTAKQRPNPVFTFGPQYASLHRTSITPWFLAGNVFYQIETAGKRTRRTEQAMAAAEAARWRISARAWAARSRVRTAMLELHSARENIRLLETEQKLHDEAIKKLTAQMEAGDVSPFELTQARLALNRTRLALQDSQRLAATGEAKLAAAVGVPLSALKSIALDFSGFTRLPAQSTSNSRRLALTQRADLMALLADYAASESALRLEYAKQYPDVRLGPGFDYNQGQNRWQLGVSFELPVNGNRGPIAQAEAKRKTAEARFLAQQDTIQGELNIALAAYEASRKKSQTAATLSQEAAAAAGTTKRMVDAGELSPLELTRRQIEASTANLARMAADIEAQTAAGALEDAMQARL